MNERHPGLHYQLLAVLLRVGIVVAPEHDFGIHPFDRLNLDLRCRLRHHDHRPEPQFLRSKSHALRMIAGAGCNHTTLALRLGEFGNLVVGASELEAEDRLLILTLQPDTVVDARGEARREFERRFVGDFINTAGQSFTKKLAQAEGSRGTHMGIVQHEGNWPRITRITRTKIRTN